MYYVIKTYIPSSCMYLLKYVMRRLKCKFKMLALAPPKSKSKSQSVEYNLTHFDEKTRHSVAVALFVV